MKLDNKVLNEVMGQLSNFKIIKFNFNPTLRIKQLKIC